jgi:hypothetical protein
MSAHEREAVIYAAIVYRGFPPVHNLALWTPRENQSS